MRVLLAALLAAAMLPPAHGADGGPFVGGGPRPSVPPTGVPAAVRARIQAEIRSFEAARPSAAAPVTEPIPVRPWAIFPQAGNLDEDIFLNGFVDLDPTSGVRDWMCGRRTYDGHKGLDSDILSFPYQAGGVPIFAALDGTVVAAHDGEWDQQTSWLNDAMPNYVTISHGGGQYGLYFHMRKGSVAVKPNDVVKAGQQIGMTGSSGFSSGPHLHFESQYNNEAYEPFAGPCREGPSHWLRQPAIRTDMFITEQAVCDAYMETYSGAVFGWPRGATFTTGVHRVTNWVTIHHMPENTTWSLRYLRPDGSLYFTGDTYSFSNPFYITANYWMAYNMNLNVTGRWTSIVTLNGVDMPPTPFFVVEDVHDAVNHPPAAITAALDPLQPGPDEPVFCRVTSALLNGDPDFDVLRYRYEWTVNSVTVRDVTTAARSDAVPAGIGAPGALLECHVTPSDGRADGDGASTSARIGGIVIGDVDGNGAFERADIVLGLRLAGGLQAASAGQVQRGGAAAGGLSILDAARLARALSSP